MRFPPSVAWTWSKAAALSMGVVLPLWAVTGFDVASRPVALVGGALLTALTRLLVLARERRGASSRTVLLLGSSPMAARLVEELEKSDDGRFRLIGVVDDSPGGKAGVGISPVLGRLDEFAHVVAATKPEFIVMAMSDRRGRVPDRTLLEARFKGAQVEEAVDFFERVTGKLAIEAMRPSSLIMSDGFEQSAFARSRMGRVIRGAVCRIAGAVGLLALSPFLIAIAVAIKLDSRGPAFFRQQRVGRGGKAFGLVKFRTMRDSGAARSSEWVSDNSSRITSVGRWLRRFRLDELPQLVNVVRGEMNFVGPRPHPMTNYELFLQHIPYYEFRSMVRPGITGWAQVRYGYANDLAEETEKMRYDFYYIKHRTLWLDLRIIVETLGVLLFDRRSHQAAKPHVPPGRLADPTPAS